MGRRWKKWGGMKDRSKRPPVAERILKGLEEAIRYHKGEITLKTTILPARPGEPPEIDAQALTALRDRSGMSQARFAQMLNVSTKTVQSWEQGVRAPSQAARRLIQIYSEHPEAVCQSVGIPPVSLSGVTIEEVAPGRRKLVVRGASTERKSRAKPAAKADPAKTEAPR